MQIGISTASLFKRYQTVDGLKRLKECGVQNVEVFFESFCEYNKKFGKKLAKIKGDVNVHSVHTLTTQFEPQLYTENSVAQKDAFEILEGMLKGAKALGAKYYTFHGPARIKRTPFKINFDRVGEITKRVCDVCSRYNVTLAYENVHWCYYNYVGFFSELKKHVPTLKGTLDIKQARQSGIDVYDLINEMGKDIVTVHLSDVDKDGKMCLPLAERGTIDFEKLFRALKDVGFDGTMLIEAYYGDYDSEDELCESLNKLRALADKIFN